MSLPTRIDHSRLYLFGLMVMAVGLPSSNVLMSIAQVILGASWLLEGRYRTQLKRFFTNKPALIFSSIYLLHLLGLFYTSDWDYAAWDLRNKVPLLVLPFLIGSSQPLSRKQIDQVFSVFALSVVTFSLVCAGELTPINNWIRGIIDMEERVIMDARNISHFISHIRFSLMICLCICWLLHQGYHQIDSNVRRYLFMILALWLMSFLFLMESVTGLAILLVIGFGTLVYLAIRQKSRSKKLASVVLLIIVPALTIGYVGRMVADFYHVNEEDPADLPKYSSSGNLYYHKLDDRQLENGNYVWRHVCHVEIEPEWEKRSAIAFKGKDRVGQFVEYTLFRYMTSRGLPKDSAGLSQMSDEEIEAVENGIANVRYTDVSSIGSRINGMIWQIDDYVHHGAPGGHSLSQRWEFWKTGLNLWRANLLLGVGTGDAYNELLKQFEADGSLLVPEYRKHPHNQYLSIAIAFGFLGLIWFAWALCYPAYMARNKLDYVTVVFLAIALLSMVAEDTLETQAGVSFVAFFYSMFLFSSGKSTA